jgi:hypothetical protein
LLSPRTRKGSCSTRLVARSSVGLELRPRQKGSAARRLLGR